MALQNAVIAMRLLSLLVGTFVCLLIAGPLAPSQVQAKVVELYTVQVDAASRADPVRKRAFRKALKRVLVRVTGRRDAPRAEGVAGLLDRAPSFVDQYRYRQIKPETADKRKTGATTNGVQGGQRREPGEEDGAQGAADSPGYRLWVQFDAGALEREISALDLPFWGAERPVSLLWVGIQDGDRRSVLAEGDSSALKATARKAARRRGLPIVIPLMDIQDQRRVQFGDIAGGFMGAIEDASRRYDADVIVVVRLRPGADGRWEARWQYRSDDLEGRQRLRAEDPHVALREGVHWLADQLAQRLAVRPGEGGTEATMVRVDGVRSLSDFLRIDRYLDGLDIVADHQVVAVVDESVRFGVHARGGADGLARVIRLGDLLERAAPSGGRRSSAPSADQPGLRYTLSP